MIEKRIQWLYNNGVLFKEDIYMAKKCAVNKAVCVGCGLCTSIAPAVFGFGDDGLAENILGNETELPEELEASVNEAAESCPVQAIEVK